MEKDNIIVKKISEQKWKKAQKYELKFQRENLKNKDDWNFWWKEKFDDYNAIKNKEFNNVLEVGCGPHTNIRLILPVIKYKKLYLEDPLIQKYSRLKLYIRFFEFFNIYKYSPFFSQLVHEKKNLILIDKKLEELPLETESIDLLICINVLDHCQDFDKCMFQMDRVLKKGGTFILGQELTNEEDKKISPEFWKDKGHPIKIDEVELKKPLKNYKEIFFRILPRENGRYPKWHYGTFLFIGKKQ